jgi:glycosyltransferase involved in cell wall biosynthesis
MSIGLPAVASSYGGNPYMVRHGENGFIYEMRSPSDLACKISRIAADRDLYDRMSEAAYRRFATELNSRKMTDETLGLYRELLLEYESGVTARE